MEYIDKLNKLKKFNKEERSSFSYWFAHYKAYNLTALMLHAWKVKYLLHDIEKPWLKLLWKDYKKVQKWHRKHNNHHLQYKNPSKIDWEAMVIDWECSRFTKTAAPLTARQEMENHKDEEKYTWIKSNMEPILTKLNL